MASDFRLKEQLPNLTDRIVKTYSEMGTINHLDEAFYKAAFRAE